MAKLYAAGRDLAAKREQVPIIDCDFEDSEDFVGESTQFDSELADSAEKR